MNRTVIPFLTKIPSASKYMTLHQKLTNGQWHIQGMRSWGTNHLKVGASCPPKPETAVWGQSQQQLGRFSQRLPLWNHCHLECDCMHAWCFPMWNYTAQHHVTQYHCCLGCTANEPWMEQRIPQLLKSIAIFLFSMQKIKMQFTCCT